MGCCVDDELTQATARTACMETIHAAVETALADDAFGVLVDALPTLGKSRTVATLADTLSSRTSGDKLNVTILTHRTETRDQIEEWAQEAGLDVHQLPRFDSDCPTAEGEFGDVWRERVHDLRRRGISPGELHANPRYDLPCSTDQTCPYVAGWEDCRDHRVLVGHPSHAYVAEVVRDRVVVFDEDPGEAFEERFDANAIHRVVGEYLSETDEITWETDDGVKPVESLDQLRSYREFGPSDQVEESLSTLRAGDLFGDSQLVGHAGGHGTARAVSLAVLESSRKDFGNGATRIDLPGNAVAVYDEVEGRLVIRRPPNLSIAAAVVGLDGTPVRRLWESRLGCPPDKELHYERVLCDDCRNRYLTDVLGYRVYQTSPHVKPYSSGRNIHTGKDLALIEAVYRETGQEPAVISTKTGVQTLEEEWSNVQDSGHYGAIKGTNRFEGDAIEVGIVIGSQHPGDHEVKRLAALGGDSVVFPEERVDRGKNLSYGITSRSNEPSNPYLTHFREHQVVQAIFRFGRHDGATVYVHTGAVPDWILTDGPIDSEDQVFRRTRSDGEQQVIDALEDSGALTVKQIVDRVDIKKRNVYDRLEVLQDDGRVERVGSKQPYRWRSVDEPLDSDVGHLIDDRWYVVVPNDTRARSD